MNGRRIPWPDGAAPHALEDALEPGDYAGPCTWEHFAGHFWLCAPDGSKGMIAPDVHTIIEHTDGTVTVSPSIQFFGADGVKLWHGYLEAGAWRTA